MRAGIALVGAVAISCASPRAEAPRAPTEPVSVAPTSSVGSVAPLPHAIGGARALAAGSGITTYAGCIVDAEKRVACWAGPNILHFMSFWGNGAPPGPLRIGIDGARRIAHGGQGDVCAVLEDGRVACKHAGDPSAASIVMQDVEDVAFGSGHACALGHDGRVRCWGTSINGVLGNGPPQPRGGLVTKVEPKDAAVVPKVESAVAISAGGYATCAVTRDAALVCWGAHPFAMAPDFSPRRIEIAHVRRAAVAHAMGCVATDDDVRCVHRGTDLRVPFEVERLDPPMPRVVDLATDGATACAVLASGQVWCWGPGPSKDLLTPEDAKTRERAYEQPKAWRVPDVDDAVQVSLAGSHACVRTRGGAVRCWGPNAHGELGDGTLVARTSPSWLVEHVPEMLPEPPSGVYGCTATVDVRRTCRKMGEECRLAAPPDYWSTGPRGGAHCGDECMKRIDAELRAKPMPPCMCTCAPEYQQRDVQQKRALQPPPP